MRASRRRCWKALGAELTHHLGYPLGAKPETATNHRNGTTPKTVLTDDGAVDLDVPRDRAGTFEPVLSRSTSAGSPASTTRFSPCMRAVSRCGRFRLSPRDVRGRRVARLNQYGHRRDRRRGHAWQARRSTACTPSCSLMPAGSHSGRGRGPGHSRIPRLGVRTDAGATSWGCGLSKPREQNSG